MTFDTTVISIGEGIGPIVFGMNTEEVENILGVANEVEQVADDDDEIGGTVWHYDDQGLSLSFEEGEGLTLTSISTTNKRYTLKGKTLIGTSYEDFQDLRTELDLGGMGYDNLSEDDGPKQVVLEFNDTGVSFWFDDDVLTEIQWGPIWNDNGDLWVRESESKIDERHLDYDEEYGN